MSLLVTCETLGLFLNALIADDKYLFCNSENLLQPSQMQFSRYRKLLLNFLLNFSNFQHFEKLNDPHSLWISEVTDSKLFS